MNGHTTRGTSAKACAQEDPSLGVAGEASDQGQEATAQEVRQQSAPNLGAQTERLKGSDGRSSCEAKFAIS